jgi:hypothetical protein
MYFFEQLGMHFKVTVIVQEAYLERWIYRVLEDFLYTIDDKIIGIDSGFTGVNKGVS